MSDTIVKNLNFGSDAKDKIFKGIDKLTKAVSSTLGASGKCVILEDNAGKPIITKDGVTVANAIILLDSVENIGATLLKEAARKTVREAGDGTTTATVLAHAILHEASNNLQNENPRVIKQGIDLAVTKVIKFLEDNSTLVDGDMINNVATISSNNDKNLGKLIGDAFKAVGNTGIVSMEESTEPETTVEIVDGIHYSQGLRQIHFATDSDKTKAELNNPLVLIVESEIPNIRKMTTILEYVIKNNKPLLIIANCDQQVYSALAMNKIKGNIKVNIIDSPIFGVTRKEVLHDLALLTGATVINEDLGDDIDLIEPEHLGTCVKAVSTNEGTIIQIGETPEEAKELIVSLEEKLKNAKLPGFKVAYEKRLARLSAKMAIVKVGANSEIELKEKKDRVEDAICATKAAIKEGIVPGGGIALLNASENIKANNASEQALLTAIKAPFATILSNAGIEKYDSPKNIGEGLDVVTGNMVNMIKAGIIDPLLVTKSALINAASVATTILSTDCVINNLRANEGSR